MDTSRPDPRPHPGLAPLVAAWLVAERGGRDREAEVQLARAFALVPHAEPRQGFAERVMAAAGLGSRPALGFLGRLAVASTVFAFAVGLAVLLPALPPLVATLDPALLFGSLGGLLADASRAFAFLARLWDGFSALAREVAAAGRTPLGLQILAACLLTAIGALRLLFSLAAERSTSHAPARFA